MGLAVVTIIIISLAAIVLYIKDKYPDSAFYEIADILADTLSLLSIIAITCTCVLVSKDINRGWPLFFDRIVIGGVILAALVILTCLADLCVTIKNKIKTKRL